MTRPPYRRQGQRAGGYRRSPWWRGLRNLLVLAVAASLLQLAGSGEVTWPGVVLERAKEVLTRPEAGWRQAGGALEKQGERREGSPPPSFDLRGRIVRVADGDTVSLLDATGQQHKIRLYAIDTPELDQAHGRAAREALSQLVYQRQVGAVVIEVDDYQRKVATLYSGEVDINLALVAAGHAWWYRYHAPHERPLEQAERQARRQRLGLWAGDDPQAPWDWRRRHRRR
ncbi:thermonuclease family protein [Parahaliea mediterranea]|uniref:Thermonuclease family protein n=1 Tax=Parahaliea mediterranea TaxID=651086 RepID=A0A939DGF3_9GAMM|nr:thermonuclease family protein [Parahaliea mediterranea]MBN7797840.1 thermonuclease family protein [Parahaliea mediterranea]